MKMGDSQDSLQPWVTATTASMTGLGIVAVCLRLLSRYEKKQRLWWDDWMIVFSMAWNLVVDGFIFAMIWNGMGLHADTIPMGNVIMIAKLLLVAEILYVINLVWTKLSFLLMYYRIFRFPYFKKMAYAIGGFIIAWVICIIFLFIFICVPVQKLWYPELPGHCINQVGTWAANAASTILTDLAILILPIPQVWRLQLRKSEKIALTVAFGLGFFVVFASVYRFTVLFSYSPLDPSYTLARTVGWTSIEMSAGIVSACLPTMRPGLHFLSRTLHIRGAFSSFFRTTTGTLTTTGHESSISGGNSRRRHGKNSSSVGRSVDDDDRIMLPGKKWKGDGGDGEFYRLSDETGTGGNNSEEHGSPLADDGLRPKDGCVSTVTRVTAGANGDMDDLNGEDEIPLHRIRVQTDFRHGET